MEVSKIRDLPELERPREKAIHYGINKLSNTELLALIIGSGGKKMNALMVAQNLLVFANSIDGLFTLSFQDYLKISGIKEATAFRFLAIGELFKRKGLSSHPLNFTDSKTIATRYRYLIGQNKNESMYLIAINKNGNLIFEKELYVGTKQSLVSNEEEIIEELRRVHAHFFVLVHNHPSSQITPSESDIISTNHLSVMAKRNQLLMLDHIIVSNSNEYYSFKEKAKLIKLK